MRSLVRDGQTCSHRPRLVVSRSTCPPLSTPPPPANSFVIGPVVINTHTALSNNKRLHSQIPQKMQQDARTTAGMEAVKVLSDVLKDSLNM